MKIKYYQAVWLDVDGSGPFMVNGAVSTERDEAISMCRNHAAVKNGAKLHWVNEWDVYE